MNYGKSTRGHRDEGRADTDERRMISFTSERDAVPDSESLARWFTMRCYGVGTKERGKQKGKGGRINTAEKGMV